MVGGIGDGFGEPQHSSSADAEPRRGCGPDREPVSFDPLGLSAVEVLEADRMGSLRFENELRLHSGLGENSHESLRRDACRPGTHHFDGTH